MHLLLIVPSSSLMAQIWKETTRQRSPPSVKIPILRFYFVIYTASSPPQGSLRHPLRR
uniref:Uncharacterized protein n=1 Tax=Arundo donax TaxID=35708 RepID=A0A0A9E347_ARUDO